MPHASFATHQNFYKRLLDCFIFFPPAANRETGVKRAAAPGVETVSHK